MSRPLYPPKWDVRFPEPDETPAAWKAFFRSAITLTMPRRRKLLAVNALHRLQAYRAGR